MLSALDPLLEIKIQICIPRIHTSTPRNPSSQFPISNLQHLYFQMSENEGSPAGEKPEVPVSEHLNIKLMDAFCERQGKAPNSVRFLFDGSRVQPTDSPDKLDMQDGDTLEVHQEQIGGQ
ncbi:hypothetical protein EYC84_009948 [Monilinia fructicola]|uniref:Ubiquitin-like domain-containing protein n=1 Tax=Monilinia fructicola TaxID=38448 RepID=A0A5M9JFX1_MONFR|nr:hypothetical protein EYC84_009948 [Monilinia fructicola]